MRLVVLLALPATTEVPAAQVAQATHGVEACPSSSQKPSAHIMAGAVPLAQYWPAVVHGAQTGSLLGVAATVCTVPGEQTPGTVHMGAFESVEWVPIAQLAQVRSLAGVPAAVTYVPGM